MFQSYILSLAYISNDGGRTLTMAKNFIFAEIYNFNTIKYTLSQEFTVTSFDQIRVYEDEKPLTIKSISTMGMPLSSGYIEF